MVAINVIPEQDSMVPKWLEDGGFGFPVLVGANSDSIISDYRLVSTPLNFLLDAEGKIISRWDGYYEGAEEEIEEAVKEALEG